MRIFLSENKFSTFILNLLNEDNYRENNIYNKKIELAQDSLEKLLANDGIIMQNISNGEDYVIYEIISLSNIIGKRYCLCRLLKNNKQYGSIYIKPLALFKEKNN